MITREELQRRIDALEQAIPQVMQEAEDAIAAMQNQLDKVRASWNQRLGEHYGQINALRQLLTEIENPAEDSNDAPAIQ